MKKEYLFLLILSLIVVPPQGRVWAQASEDALVSAYLDAGEKKAAPRWRSSLEEIQAVSNALIETNHKLTLEYGQLKLDLTRSQERVDALRARNAALADEISGLQHGAAGNAAFLEVATLKAAIEERMRTISSQQSEIAALKLKQRDAQGKLVLLRQKAATLEVVQKARALDVQARGQEKLKALRAELDLIRTRLAATQEQAKLIGAKTEELAKVDKPYVPESREVAAQNAALREDVAVLSAKLAPQRAQLESLLAKKAAAEAAPNVKRLNALLLQQEAAGMRLKDDSQKLALLKARIEEMEKAAAAPLPSAEAVDKLQRQNSMIGEEVSNLRENIALLEYKINSLESYTNRNKPAPRSK